MIWKLYRVRAQNESQGKSGNFRGEGKVSEKSVNLKAVRESQGKSWNFYSSIEIYTGLILACGHAGLARISARVRKK